MYRLLRVPLINFFHSRLNQLFFKNQQHSPARLCDYISGKRQNYGYAKWELLKSIYFNSTMIITRLAVILTEVKEDLTPRTTKFLSDCLLYRFSNSGNLPAVEKRV